MAEEENQTTETDIFQQQKKTIDTLIDVLAKQGGPGAQPVFLQPAAEPQTKSPNYLLYIAIGAVGLLLFTKR